MPELVSWFGWLSARLRHVRIMSGDWRRSLPRRRPARGDRLTALEKLQAIDDDGVDLTPWEVGFVAGLIDDGRTRFSPKQVAIIDRLHAERVPK